MGTVPGAKSLEFGKGQSFLDPECEIIWAVMMLPAEPGMGEGKVGEMKVRGRCCGWSGNGREEGKRPRGGGGGGEGEREREREREREGEGERERERERVVAITGY